MIEKGRGPAQAAFGRFWQLLPALLERSAAEPMQPLSAPATGLSCDFCDETETKENEVIDLQRIARAALRTEPYEWAEVGDLFSGLDAAALAESFPWDHYKIVAGYGGRKGKEPADRPPIFFAPLP